MQYLLCARLRQTSPMSRFDVDFFEIVDGGSAIRRCSAGADWYQIPSRPDGVTVRAQRET